MFPCMYSGLFILCLFVCYVFAGSEWVGSFQLSIWDVGQEGALWPGKQPKAAGSFFNLCGGLASVLFFSISVVVKKDLYKLLLDMPVYFS